MVSFTKFDPQAFLEKEGRAAGCDGPAGTSNGTSYSAGNFETLAAFATLAPSPSKNENQDVGKSSAITDHHNQKENRNSESGPAKVAKVAKDEPSGAAEDNTPWGEKEEERAAVAEYDGGATRSWAEALARLDPARPACDIPLGRWLRFIDDCGRFLDDGWAACAERLGWTPLDLFGCDRAKPFSRINRAGLL